MKTDNRLDMTREAVARAENPEALSVAITNLDPFRHIRAIREFRTGGNMTGAIQYYITNADELVELHARYAEIVQKSHEFYMEHLDEETREFLLREAQTIIGYIYRHIESWIPYSLFFEANETDIAGVGFSFNIALVDVREHIDNGREATLLELQAAEEALENMLSDLDDEAEPLDPEAEDVNEHLVVLLNPEDTIAIKALAEAEGVLESDVVSRALMAELRRE